MNSPSCLASTERMSSSGIGSSVSRTAFGRFFLCTLCVDKVDHAVFKVLFIHPSRGET